MATYNQTNKNCKQVQQGSDNLAINNEKEKDNGKDSLKNTLNSKKLKNEINKKDKASYLHSQILKKQGSKHNKKYQQFDNENEKKCDCAYQAYRQPKSQRGLNHYRFGGPDDGENPVLKCGDYPAYSNSKSNLDSNLHLQSKQKSSNKPKESQDTNFHEHSNDGYNGRSKSRSPSANVDESKGGRPRPRTRSPIKPRQGPRGRH